MTNLTSTSASTVKSQKSATPAMPAHCRVARKPAPTASTNAAPAAKVTKRDEIVALLLRDEGATLDQMIAATGWLPHTTRAALTGLTKRGYAIGSGKIDGVRTYRAVAPK